MSATIHTRTNPVLIDGVIAEIQTQMAQRVEWLNNIFGRVEKLVKNVNGRTIYSANQYKGGNEYTLIAPDSGLGNFAFFVVDEPETMDYYRGDRTHFSTPFSLVVWVDMRTIASGENRNTEAVKQEIVRFLNDELRLRSGRMYVNRIFSRAESIFKGFTLDEIDNQFLMQPFCGWRFEGEIEFYDTCAPYVPPTPPVEPQYIRGHINDGANTFTFKINNQNITVNVDVNGWWQWDADIVVTSFESAFYLKKNIDYIRFVGFKDITNCAWLLNADQNADEWNLKRVEFVDCDFSKVTDETRMFRGRAGLREIIGLDSTKHSLNTTLNTTFQNCKSLALPSNFNWSNLIGPNVTDFTGTFMNAYCTDYIDVRTSGIPTTIYYIASGAKSVVSLFLQNIPSDCNVNGFMTGSPIINFDAIDIKANLNLAGSSQLSKQSILNLINKSTANVTHTLYRSVYNKCASGGEWHDDIQAAIDAKAAQGFTVTLISA